MSSLGLLFLLTVGAVVVVVPSFCFFFYSFLLHPTFYPFLRVCHAIADVFRMQDMPLSFLFGALFTASFPTVKPSILVQHSVLKESHLRRARHYRATSYPTPSAEHDWLQCNMLQIAVQKSSRIKNEKTHVMFETQCKRNEDSWRNRVQNNLGRTVATSMACKMASWVGYADHSSHFWIC